MSNNNKAYFVLALIFMISLFSNCNVDGQGNKTKNIRFERIDHFSKITDSNEIMNQVYKYMGTNSPEKSKNKWFKLMSDLGLENDLKKLFRNNNGNRSLKMYDIKYIVKSINIERLQNHPVKLSNKQLEYAANDVIYLHQIKKELEQMLIRENRMEVFKKCLSFLDTRVELDQSGFKFDIFEH